MNQIKTITLCILHSVLCVHLALAQLPVGHWNKTHPKHSSHWGLVGKIAAMNQKTYNASMHVGKVVKGALQEPQEKTDAFNYNYSVRFESNGRVWEMRANWGEDASLMRKIQYDCKKRCLAEMTYLIGSKPYDQMQSVMIYEYAGDTLKHAYCHYDTEEKNTCSVNFDVVKPERMSYSIFHYESSESFTDSIKDGRVAECVKVESYFDENNKTRHQYTYNAYGHIIKDVQTQTHEFNGVIDKKQKGNNHIYTYSYEYDKHNNWTKRVKYVDGKVSTVTERDIHYSDY